MMYEGFHKYNLDIAKSDQFIVCKQYNDPKLEDNYFAFFECYCSDIECDCRHVYLDVMKRENSKADSHLIGKISFGLDSLQFHLKWFHVSKPDKDHLQYIGPSVIEVFDKSENENLQDFVKMLKEDKSLKEKFMRHYLLHKAALTFRQQKDRLSFIDNKNKFDAIINEVTENYGIHILGEKSIKKRIFNAMKSDTFTKQGRNELCNCGSGKKYKTCCGKL